MKTAKQLNGERFFFVCHAIERGKSGRWWPQGTDSGPPGHAKRQLRGGRSPAVKPGLCVGWVSLLHTAESDVTWRE